MFTRLHMVEVLFLIAKTAMCKRSVRLYKTKTDKIVTLSAVNFPYVGGIFRGLAVVKWVQWLFSCLFFWLCLSFGGFRKQYAADL